MSKAIYSASRKVPFIGCDIDGVLKLGKIALPKAKESVKLIRDKDIPFLLITNAGGDLECNRSKYISKILNIQDDEKYRIKPHEIILCHSPMRNLYNMYKDKLLLINGVDRYEEVIVNYGFTNYMTVNEYAHIFHKDLLPYKKYYTNDLNKLESDYRNKVEKRLNRSLKTYPRINCIFNLTDTRNLFEAVQVILY